MSLPELDTALFFLINKDLQNSFFDRIMPLVTSHAFLDFFPFLLLLSVKEKKKALPAILTGLFAIALADATSHMLKELFMR
ncbi:MAG: phosphatase PAP2 family protein, partial [Nitrospirae bacterium]|nr:phosphatase PAP2 family protein [Nitrospirota bacterium]